MKRFTETEKWRDPWFRQLPPALKLGYLFILDHCNAAGVWEFDPSLAEFHIGSTVDWEELKKQMGEDRLKIMPNGRWLVLKFVGFQWGTLSPDCKQHKHVLKIIEEQGLGYKQNRLWVGARVAGRVGATGGSALHRRAKEKEQEQERIGGAGGKEPAPDPTPEEVYEEYPKKVARQDGIKAIRRAIDRIADEKLARPELGEASPARWLMARIQAYAKAVSEWPAGEEDFIPHPATWFNQGRYDDDDRTWAKHSGKNGTKPLATPDPPRRAANLPPELFEPAAAR